MAAQNPEEMDEDAPYGRCILCNTPYVTYKEQSSSNEWKVGKTCPNSECPK